MEKLFKKHWKTGLFTLIGAIAGLAYWRFIGCTSGTCALTSNWHTTTLFGGLVGMMASPANRKSGKKEAGETIEASGTNSTIETPEADLTPEAALKPEAPGSAEKPGTIEKS